jgi:RNA polymerase sigma factor (sigma-70 family)
MITLLAAANLKNGPAPACENDEAMIAGCVEGQRAAWDALVGRYGRLVYSIPKRYGLSDADADDVFQDVFLIVYRKLGTLCDLSRLSSWLISVAHRESCRVARRSGRYVSMEHDLTQDAEPPRQEAAAWESQDCLRRALRQLGGPSEQLLVALFSAPGRPNYEQIAQRLGMKTSSIGPTRARCFKKLEKILIDSGWEPRRNDTATTLER